jgi:hypothetical protein
MLLLLATNLSNFLSYNVQNATAYWTPNIAGTALLAIQPACLQAIRYLLGELLKPWIF